MTNKETFQDGNVLVVERTTRSGKAHWTSGEVMTCVGNWPQFKLEPDSKIEGKHPNYTNYEFRLVAKTKQSKYKQLKEGDKMNSVIVKLFDKTKDAVLVETYLGEHILNTPVELIKLEGSQVELLKEAKRLEQEAKENKSN